MLLIGLALVVGAAGIGAWLYYDKSRGSEAVAQPVKGAKGRGGKGGKGGDGGPIPVVAGVAQMGDIPIYLSGLGTVVPQRTVTVRSRVDGELLRVNFTEGQYVKEGELLAQVDPRPFQVQLDQMEGQLIKDQALLANARIDLERYRTLFKQDSIASQQVDTQAALVQQYEGTVRTDKALVDNARLQLSYARITAPISGRLGLRQTDPGNIVHAADANGVVVITEVQPITVVFTLPQDNL
ncbi:MAG TPA: efflux RND transporter periplasmic adaptor subunit, partial [Burkholderiales bacterium]|nr:efflux RND transporter periplasmic adaptor subunit [Burkholderiales bacterium]